jgi:hypothetical protein
MPDRHLNVVLLREAVDEVVLVFPDAFSDFRRDTDMQRAKMYMQGRRSFIRVYWVPACAKDKTALRAGR